MWSSVFCVLKDSLHYDCKFATAMNVILNFVCHVLPLLHIIKPLFLRVWWWTRNAEIMETWISHFFIVGKTCAYETDSQSGLVFIFLGGECRLQRCQDRLPSLPRWWLLPAQLPRLPPPLCVHVVITVLEVTKVVSHLPPQWLWLPPSKFPK